MDRGILLVYLDVVGVLFLICCLACHDVGGGLSKVPQELEGPRFPPSRLLAASGHLQRPVVLIHLQEVLQVPAVLQRRMHSLETTVASPGVNGDV